MEIGLIGIALVIFNGLKLELVLRLLNHGFLEVRYLQQANIMQLFMQMINASHQVWVVIGKQMCLQQQVLHK